MPMSSSDVPQKKQGASLDYFDNVASRWSDKYRRTGTFSERLSLVLAEVPERGEATQLALDAGCGTGELVGALADRGFRVMGVDASQEMLRSAPKPFPRALADVARLPLPDSSCTVVTAISVLEYLPDPMSVFFARVHGKPSHSDPLRDKGVLTSERHDEKGPLRQGGHDARLRRSKGLPTAWLPVLCVAWLST